MNKALILMLVPCIVAFVMVQAQLYPGAGGYGGVGGYGLPQYYQSQRYYNYGRQQTRQSNLFTLCKYCYAKT